MTQMFGKMKKGFSSLVALLLVLTVVAGLTTALSQDVWAKSKKKNNSQTQQTEITVEEDGQYTSKEEVALYIHEYGCLPSNFITKNEAKDLGWDSRSGNLDEVAPGMSIGGDRFGNYEGLLPDA